MSTQCLSIQRMQVFRQEIKVLDIPQLQVNSGELLAVIGPNGAGKSSLLLSIASLLPYSGQIFLNGVLINQTQSLSARREMALVMQDPPLLHTSVYENVALGLRFRGTAEPEVQRRVNQWLDRLQIRELAHRPANHISGGEAQRVALARAFVLQPALLLLDEPFSALDKPSRQSLLSDLRNILDETHVTTLFVTHDLDEALSLSDRVAVLINGELRQIGSAQEVFSAPGDREIAEFVGVESLLAGVVEDIHEGLLNIRTGSGHVQGIGDAHIGQSVWVCLRPEEITLQPAPDGSPSSARNHIPGVIQQMAIQGPLMRVTLAGDCPLVALITRTSARELGLHKGMAVIASFKASTVHIIPR